jgi:hypothetical protein
VIGEKGRAQLIRDQRDHIAAVIQDIGKVRITFSQVQADTKSHSLSTHRTVQQRIAANQLPLLLPSCRSACYHMMHITPCKTEPEAWLPSLLSPLLKL